MSSPDVVKDRNASKVRIKQSKEDEGATVGSCLPRVAALRPR